MLFRYLDDDKNRGSDAVKGTDRELFSDDYESLNAGKEINPQTESYNSMASEGGRPSDFEDSGYDSPNAGNYSDPEFRKQYEAQRRGNLIAQAKKGLKQGTAKAFNAGKKFGGEDTPENRELAKAEARKKVRKIAKDKIASKITDKGLSAGFKKGLSKEAGAAAKEGVKRAGKQAVKSAGQALGKGAAKGAAQAGVKIGQGAITGAGVTSGAATFGLGFLLSLLLNIAISLGVNDAVEAGFELKSGNVKHATFLAIRAAAKIGVFLYLLVTICFMVSIGGIFIGVPLLIILNIYIILGFLLPKIPNLQGAVWWEIAIVAVLDFFGFLIISAFIGALGWWLCNEAGLGAGGVQGAVAGAAVAIFDWWNETSAGSVAADFCKYVKNGV